jgi:hypothetical protein
MCVCWQAEVEALVSMCTADNVDQLLQGNPDYVLDAIDNIDTKVRRQGVIMSGLLANALQLPAHSACAKQCSWTMKQRQLNMFCYCSALREYCSWAHLQSRPHMKTYHPAA